MDSQEKRKHEEAFQLAMDRAVSTSAPRVSLKYPWEENQWLRSTLPVTGSTDFMTSAVRRITDFNAPLPPVPAELVAAPAPAPVWKQNKFAFALERMMKSKFKSQRVGEEVIRAHALTRWKIILDSSPESFELCRQAIEDMEISGSLQLAQVLEDTLAAKSTNTLTGLQCLAYCWRQR